MIQSSPRTISPPLVALAGWILPGLGYWLIGQRARGVIAGIAILFTFVAGLLIGGVRVIDVPGYDVLGNRRMSGGQWRLQAEFVPEVMNKPWYIAQTLVGPANIIATWKSLDLASDKVRMSTARVFDIGTLYTAVAGMLNLLVMIDASYRAANPKRETAVPKTPPSEPAGAK